MSLLDNYERSLGVAEQVTTEELTEVNLFLDAVLETEVMKVRLIRPTLLHYFPHLGITCESPWMCQASQNNNVSMLFVVFLQSVVLQQHLNPRGIFFFSFLPVWLRAALKT